MVIAVIEISLWNSKKDALSNAKFDLTSIQLKSKFLNIRAKLKIKNWSWIRRRRHNV